MVQTRANVEGLGKLLSSCTLAPPLTVSVYSIDGEGVISYSGIYSYRVGSHEVT